MPKILGTGPTSAHVAANCMMLSWLSHRTLFLASRNLRTLLHQLKYFAYENNGVMTKESGRRIIINLTRKACTRYLMKAEQWWNNVICETWHMPWFRENDLSCFYRLAWCESISEVCLTIMIVRCGYCCSLWRQWLAGLWSCKKANDPYPETIGVCARWLVSIHELVGVSRC